MSRRRDRNFRQGSLKGYNSPIVGLFFLRYYALGLVDLARPTIKDCAN